MYSSQKLGRERHNMNFKIGSHENTFYVWKFVWTSGFQRTLNLVSGKSLFGDMAFRLVFMFDMRSLAIGRAAVDQRAGLRGLDLVISKDFCREVDRRSKLLGFVASSFRVTS
ncbi:hypothetical protein TNCV_2572111 [Trichonephila clavipes]|nr:hypothetical protein TNCV_2572111 [Trichonephila clavipes]